MNTDLHRVTIPINDYNNMIRDNNNLTDRAELAEAKIHLIKEVIDYPVMERTKRLEEIKTILGG